MADVKEMDIDPGYAFLATYMWRHGITELEFSEGEVTAAFDAMEGQSILIVPTQAGHKILIGSREMAEKLSEGLDLETGEIDAGVTIN